MEFTVELLEKERNELFEKAKTHSDIIDLHMNEYKELDEKICELDNVLHQLKKGND